MRVAISNKITRFEKQKVRNSNKKLIELKYIRKLLKVSFLILLF